MEFSTLLGYIIWSIDPDIFVIPFLNHPVRWYGLSWAFGFLFSQQIMFYIYKKEGRPSSEVDTLTIYMVVAAVLGARLGHVLFYDPVHYFHEPIQILAIWEGGLASHGGGIGVLIALYFFAKKTQVPYLWIVDQLAIVSAFIDFLTIVANLMNSDIAGLHTLVLWSFIFPSIDNVSRHLAQDYATIYCLFIFLFLFWMCYKKRN